MNKETDFQKAVKWFTKLPHEEMVAICKEVNPDTPHSINDKYLVPMWKKHSNQSINSSQS
jgi:hypothetical protein